MSDFLGVISWVDTRMKGVGNRKFWWHHLWISPYNKCLSTYFALFWFQAWYNVNLIEIRVQFGIPGELKKRKIVMMSEINGVNSPEKKFHLFRSLSELKQESKGGYIDTEFIVPHGTKTIELGLYFISIQMILCYFLSDYK